MMERRFRRSRTMFALDANLKDPFGMPPTERFNVTTMDNDVKMTKDLHRADDRDVWEGRASPNNQELKTTIEPRDWIIPWDAWHSNGKKTQRLPPQCQIISFMRCRNVYVTDGAADDFHHPKIHHLLIWLLQRERRIMRFERKQEMKLEKLKVRGSLEKYKAQVRKIGLVQFLSLKKLTSPNRHFPP